MKESWNAFNSLYEGQLAEAITHDNVFDSIKEQTKDEEVLNYYITRREDV